MVCGLTYKCSPGAIKWLSNVIAMGPDNYRNQDPKMPMEVVLKEGNFPIEIGMA